MIRHLAKYFTLSIISLNLACIYSTDDRRTGYKASFEDSVSLCKYIDPESLQSVSKLDVPYMKQKTNYCGPASLAMVLQFMGDDITQEEIGAGLVDNKGMTPAELQQKAVGLGYQLSIISCGFNNLLSLVDNGKPIIVRILNNTRDNGHFLVVVGYDMNQSIIYVNDPENPSRKTISFSEFKKLWDITTLGVDENSQNLMLVVSK